MPRSTAKIRAFLWSVLAVLLYPAAAHACPVCFAADEHTRGVYYLTTVVMTLLPLVILAVIGGWLYFRVTNGRKESVDLLDPS